MREPALDALCAAFDGLIFGRCKKGVQVFRHDDESVKQVPACVAIVEAGFEEHGRSM